jgi:two-component system, NtrC family, response regulator AtoC
MRPRVLIADDETLLRESIARAFEAEGMLVDRAATAAAAIECFQKSRPDLVVLDLKLPDRNGLEVLREINALSSAVRVLVITAHGTIANAVEAMKLGAFDFVRKPFDLEELLSGARNALRTLQLEQRLAYHDERERRTHDEHFVPGRSPAMTALWKEVEIVAAQPVPVVLVIGESGTGKSLVARALHYRSPRSRAPFVELNAAAIPETLVESELFGHERGAFSDARDPKAGLAEIADGGTLFLDEIGDLSAGAQAKLLSFLESRSFRRLGATELRTVDVRIVAATNRPLDLLMAEKKIRSDLYYRLSAMTLHVPPLRERREDIPLLAKHFVDTFAQRFRKRTVRVSEPAEAVLTRWSWPGNVRELMAVMQRSVLMNDAEILDVEHLPAEIIASSADVVPELSTPNPPRLPTLEEVELRYIRAVYALCKESKVRAAEVLGVTRQTLARRLGVPE